MADPNSKHVFFVIPRPYGRGYSSTTSSATASPHQASPHPTQ